MFELQPGPKNGGTVPDAPPNTWVAVRTLSKWVAIKRAFGGEALGMYASPKEREHLYWYDPAGNALFVAWKWVEHYIELGVINETRGRKKKKPETD